MKSDFNGNGKADVLWQDISGSRAIWLMNGITYSSGVYLGTAAMSWNIRSYSSSTPGVGRLPAIRVYQGRQLFAEVANPSTLLREKVEWSRRGVIVIGNGLVKDQSS